MCFGYETVDDFFLFVYLSLCVYPHTPQHACKVRRQLVGSALLAYHIGCQNQAQVIGFGGEYLLSHLVSLRRKYP